MSHGLLFIFTCVSVGYADFSNNEIRIYCEPDRPSSVFFSCEMAVNMARKAWSKVCPVFNLEKKTSLQVKAYLYVGVTRALFSLYF